MFEVRKLKTQQCQSLLASVYLILKLQSMPKWSFEGLSAVALLLFKLDCWILVIYYIKWGLFQQKLAPLYVSLRHRQLTEYAMQLLSILSKTEHIRQQLSNTRSKSGANLVNLSLKIADISLWPSNSFKVIAYWSVKNGPLTELLTGPLLDPYSIPTGTLL